MVQRAALLAVIALVWAAAPASAQWPPDPNCREPVIAFDVTPLSKTGLVRYNEVLLDARKSHYPSHEHSPIDGFYADWLPGNLYWGWRHTVVQLTRAGWNRVGVEHRKCDGTHAITWRSIHVQDIAPWTDIPWGYRRYGGPKPMAIRGHTFVDDQQRIRRANRRGVAVRVTCPRACIVDSALQVTRYRARRVGLASPGARRNLALASNTEAALEHRLVLRPDRRTRRLLSRQRRVPARVLVVVRALNGAKHLIPAEVELRR